MLKFIMTYFLKIFLLILFFIINDIFPEKTILTNINYLKINNQKLIKQNSIKIKYLNDNLLAPVSYCKISEYDINEMEIFNAIIKYKNEIFNYPIEETEQNFIIESITKKFFSMNLKKHSKILVVGPGVDLFPMILNELNLNVSLIDINKHIITHLEDLYQRINSQHKIKFYSDSKTFKDIQFEYVTLFAVTGYFTYKEYAKNIIEDYLLKINLNGFLFVNYFEHFSIEEIQELGKKVNLQLEYIPSIDVNNFTLVPALLYEYRKGYGFQVKKMQSDQVYSVKSESWFTKFLSKFKKSA